MSNMFSRKLGKCTECGKGVWSGDVHPDWLLLMCMECGEYLLHEETRKTILKEEGQEALDAFDLKSEDPGYDVDRDDFDVAERHFERFGHL